MKSRKFLFISLLLINLFIPLYWAGAQDGGGVSQAGEVQTEEKPAETTNVTAEALPAVPLANSEKVNTRTTDTAVIETVPPVQAAQEAAGTVRPKIAATAASAAENTIQGIGDAAKQIHIIDLLERIGIAVAIVAGQVFLIWLVWQVLFKKISASVLIWGRKTIKPLTIKKLKLLTTQQILNTLEFLLRILKYILTVFQLFITLPIIFSLFPATQNLSSTLFGYILNPLKNILMGFITYIPNLITIVIMLWVTKYVLRALKFFAMQIERERLVINGFYADWAQPTFNILRVLVYAFTMVVIYPYLPGSGSPIFQGVSVFIGIIFSLGSTSAIGNLIAGLVITYMRPFKIGDRIQIQNTTGFVVEKTLMVVRIKTHKNEYVTYPNTMILSAGITNYNTSSDEDEEGLIIYATVTMNYAIPWPQVHEILIAAALKTKSILKTPKPFVLQTALDDFYCRYQINGYTKEVNRVPGIYSDLYENLQNGFAEAGIDLTAPQYRINIPYEPPKLPPA
ncbi:MAG: mechanosensitive ion channel family protein [Treponema sp.]|jgi:small-conductance mechanosensitive channel|nr:mechanosensitive ion channel family protein [Treponema sp.]